MTITYAGRIESRFTVPSGGAAFTAGHLGMASSVSLTIPAGNFYLTAAGGVTGLLDNLVAGQLNWYAQPYPQTVASIASAIGYGTWTTGAGWLMNESSGSLAATFGAPSLTAVSTPTYGATGPAGGIDKAIGFDSALDAFSGGNVFDVGAADDLIIALVFKCTSSAGSADWCGKGWNPNAGYSLSKTGGLLNWWLRDGAASPLVQVSTQAGNGYAVGLFCLNRGSLKIAAGTMALGNVASLSTGTAAESLGTLSNVSNFVIGSGAAWSTADTALSVAAAYVVKGAGVAANLANNIATATQNFANAINSTWTASLSTTDGRISIAHSYWTWSLTWTSTQLRDLLGFTANISNSTTTQTGTYAAHGVWLPDCPLYMETDPLQAPRVTDTRQSESPTGFVLGLGGNSKYRHRQLVWSAVPRAQVWESAATYANGSWETFLKDTQFGMGHAWFTNTSRVQIYFDNAGTQIALGSTFNSGAGVSGWFIKGISSCEPPMTRPPWTGLWRIEIPELVSDS